MYPVIDRIAWAVPPSEKSNTRPAELVRELQRLGVVSRLSSYYFHGRGSSDELHSNLGRWFPSPSFDDHSLAVLSPVVQLGSTRPVWVDYYDDWSIAPDINVYHRGLAAHTYRRVRSRSRQSQELVTTNSLYMAGKLGVPSEHVVPNGVQHELGSLARSGDSARRLILLGHFFRGRTDLRMIEQVVRSGHFAEIVIGGAAAGSDVVRAVYRVASDRAHITTSQWMSPTDIVAIAGDNTVACIPHVVSDYTLSQDPMKFYQFIALGLPVISPRLLWPPSVDRNLGFLIDFGASLDGNLVDWIHDCFLPDEERKAFADKHSWTDRAQRVAALLAGAS